MLELQSRNPFITAECMREFKHYQFFNEENYLKLIGFINDFIKFADENPTPLHKFDVDYCKKYNLYIISYTIVIYSIILYAT